MSLIEPLIHQSKMNIPSTFFDVTIFMIPLLVGLGVPAIFISDYKQCGIRPSIQPPGYVFGIAWTILYTLYGGSCLAAWIESKRTWTLGLITSFISLFALTTWSLVFLNSGWCYPCYAFIAILVNLGLVVGTVVLYVRDKMYLAASLLVPLVAWLVFASYLSFLSIPLG